MRCAGAASLIAACIFGAAMLLSLVLKTVVSQQLMPTVDGGLVPVFEIMHLTKAIRNLVRGTGIHQINAAMQTDAADGMTGMDKSILRLAKAGKITKETALQFAMNQDQMQKKL